MRVTKTHLGRLTCLLSLIQLGICGSGIINASPQQQSRDQPPTTELAPEILDRYVGSYRLPDGALITVSRQGSLVYARVIGQRSLRIFPESQDHFYYREVDAQITFAAGGIRAPSLVVHQHGRDVIAARVSDEVAAQVMEATAVKIASNRPTPGSDEALVRYLTGLGSGTPPYSEMSPRLAAATQQKAATLQQLVAQWGPVLSTKFVAVGSRGWDVYAVTFERATSNWTIHVGTDGVIEDVSKLKL